MISIIECVVDEPLPTGHDQCIAELFKYCGTDVCSTDVGNYCFAVGCYQNLVDPQSISNATRQCEVDVARGGTWRKCDTGCVIYTVVNVAYQQSVKCSVSIKICTCPDTLTDTIPWSNDASTEFVTF